jgi:hypothetical protein
LSEGGCGSDAEDDCLCTTGYYALKVLFFLFYFYFCGGAEDDFVCAPLATLTYADVCGMLRSEGRALSLRTLRLC